VLLDVPSGSVATLLRGAVHDPVAAVALSPDGKCLAVTTRGGTLRRWDVSGRQVGVAPGGPPAGVHSLAFSRDGKTLVSGSREELAEVTRAFGRGWPGNYRTVAGGDNPPALRVWDVASGRQQAVLPLPPRVRLECLGLAPDGRTLAAGYSAGAVGLWDLAAGRQRSLLFVRPGERELWQWYDLVGRIVPLNPEFPTQVRACAWAPDGRRLATASSGGLVQLWDAATGGEVATPWAGGGTDCLAFAPDGSTLAFNRGERVALWDVACGQARPPLPGDPGGVSSLAFSPDGRLLAAGTREGRILLWDPVAGQERTELLGHRERVAGLAFAPDGKVLASGSWDGTVRLWHLATAQEVLVLGGDGERVHCVAFAPEGSVLAGGGETATGTGDVRLWRADPEAAAAPAGP
jgi:WD40 repeat protein